VVATAVHAAALAALLVVPVRSVGAPASRASEPSAELVIAMEDGLVAPLARDDDRPSQPGSSSPSLGTLTGRTATGPSSGLAAASPAVTIGASSEALAASSEGESTATSTPRAAGSGSVTLPIPLSTAELGIGGQNPFLPRAEEKEPTTGPDHPAARAMRGTGLAHDRALGLGPEGPVVAALADATKSSIAPLRGRAVFVVRTGGDGLVLGIDVVDSEGGSGWLDAGRLALEGLRGRKIVVPQGANGMNMRIEVRSDMMLPNGEGAAVGVRRGANKMPELTIPDVSNVGAKPRRVVHSRVVSTELL
jgi:hypothetical protein